MSATVCMQWAAMESVTTFRGVVDATPPRLNTAKAVVDFLHSGPMAERDLRERFVAIYLDSKLRLVAWRLISLGTLDGTVVHPREVFAGAIEHRASSVVLCHNHPSGDPTPSTEDVLLTKRFEAGGELLGIPVADHIIVGDADRFFSFRSAGMLS